MVKNGESKPLSIFDSIVKSLSSSAFKDFSLFSLELSAGKLSKALAISTWLKSKGLVHEQDYSWHLLSANRQIVFSFQDPKWESMLVLKYDH